MVSGRNARAALIGFTLWFAVLAVGVGAAPPVATAAEANRAVVIVDTGTEVHEVVISFTEDSISGIQALEIAGAEPETLALDPGASVCELYGVGDPAASDCFNGQYAATNDYWAYFQAPSGESTFVGAPVDPGTAQVHDGDVEGWKWGTGDAPVYVSLAELTAQPPAGGEQPPTGEPPASGEPTTTPSTTTTTRPVATAPPAKTPVSSGPSATAPKPVVARVVVKRTLPLTGGAAKKTTKTAAPAPPDASSARRYESLGDSDEPDPLSSPADQFAGATLASSRHDSATWSYVGLGLLVVATIGMSVLYQTRRRPA